jgi:PAS domain S-box-containing protein
MKRKTPTNFLSGKTAEVKPVSPRGRRAPPGVESDVSERIKMERALRYSESRFHDMCDFLPQIIFEANRQGILTYANRRAFENFGFSRDEFASGLPLAGVLTAEDLPRAEELIGRLLAGGTPHGAEYIARRKDGSQFPVLVSTAPMVRDGRIHGIRGVVMDITDRKVAEAQKLEFEKRMQLAQKIDSLGILAGGIAHDFNNLLGGIYGYIEMAMDECEGNDRAVSCLRKAEITFERAKDLTMQLLTFAKGGAPIRAAGHLAPLLRDNTKFALSGSNVTCVFRIDRDLRLCDFDKNQIGQVVDNLVINARQAMPSGGRLTVCARNVSLTAGDRGAEQKKDFIKISFSDTGKGIPSEVLPKIFDPFFTTKEKGSGLGLTTVYSIIKKHDGDISVESTPGKGTDFHILLPASAQTAPVAFVSVRSRHKGGGRMLVMDDEPAMREILGAMLGSMGYSVDYAADGWEALDRQSEAKRKGRRYVAIFMDLTVPGGMGGRETIAQWRQADPESVAIVVSGYSQNPVMSEPGRYGFTDRLQKPFKKSDLAELLNRHVR